MYQRWMNQFGVLDANEEAKLQENPSYKMKSFIDTDV